MKIAVRLLAISVLALLLRATGLPLPRAARFSPADAIVFTQLPVQPERKKAPEAAGGMLRSDYGQGGHLVLLDPDGATRILSQGFESAADPNVSFDGERILFAGRRSAADNWNIYEIEVNGSEARQITRNLGDCRNPVYLPTLYTIVSAEPWYQVGFTSNEAGELNEAEPLRSTSLYSCKLDGSEVRRLTYNPSSDLDPFLSWDGRLLFAGWQRSNLERGFLGRISLFGINIDGTDLALFSGDEGRRIKHMPCATSDGQVVFVEADRVPWDGAGQLAAVSLRRNLHSHRQITRRQDGLFHSPSPLPDGSVLVSRRSVDGSGSHGIYRLDPDSGQLEALYDDPRYHDIQARLIRARREPDGRSSVVTEADSTGELYCLNAYITDFEEPSWIPPGMIRRLRVLEGIPLSHSQSDAFLEQEQAARLGVPWVTVNGIAPVLQKRLLGEVPVENDGSFYIKVPANVPIQLQILDEKGMALRTCGWIWARNHEPRGCIGCHEDGELTPENRMVDAVKKSPIPLTLPAERRRSVDFRRDVMPIISAKCAVSGCHVEGGRPPRLDDGPERIEDSRGAALFNGAYVSLLAPERAQGQTPFGKYVHPGRARTSPLIWHLLGENCSRPWDGIQAQRNIRVMPPLPTLQPLSEAEKRAFVEWVDLGGHWSGVIQSKAGADTGPSGRNNGEKP